MVHPQWETSQQAYGGWTGEKNTHYRSERRFTPNGPKAVAITRAAVAKAAPDMFYQEKGAAKQAAAVPRYGGTHNHFDSEEHLSAALVSEVDTDVLTGAAYGKGFEHKDTEDHFAGGSLVTDVGDEMMKIAKRQANISVDALAIGVEAIPHQGGGHEDKDTEDHMGGAGGGFVPQQERELDGKYGAGHEKLDTLDHFETGTLVPTAEASLVDTVHAANPMGSSNLSVAMAPHARASDMRFAAKKPNKSPRKKGYATKKINLLGIDTSTSRQDRLAWRIRTNPPTKKAPQQRAVGRNAGRANGTASSFPKVENARAWSASSPRSSGSKAAVANAANLVRAMSARSARQSPSKPRTPSAPAVAPSKPRTPSARAPKVKTPVFSGPGKREHDVQGFDRLMGAGAHYGGDHGKDDSFDHITEGMVAADPAVDETKLQRVGQHYGGANQHKDTYSNLGPGMNPVYRKQGESMWEGDANTDKVDDEVHAAAHAAQASYGTRYVDEDSRDHFGAGLAMDVQKGGFTVGLAEEEDRVTMHRGAKYGAGHEDMDTKSHIKVVDGILTTEENSTTAANQLYGQHYGADHQNKDTFSNLGHGLIPNARPQGLGAYMTAEEKANRETRRNAKPVKTKISYGGMVHYTPHSVENDIRFRDADLKKTGSFLPKTTANFGANEIRGAGYVLGKGATAFGEDKALRSTKSMMVFPGKAVVKIMNVEDDIRYQRYDGKLAKSTASVSFPGYTVDPNLTTVAKEYESTMKLGGQKLLDSELVLA